MFLPLPSSPSLYANSLSSMKLTSNTNIRPALQRTNRTVQNLNLDIMGNLITRYNHSQHVSRFHFIFISLPIYTKSQLQLRMTSYEMKASISNPSRSF